MSTNPQDATIGVSTTHGADWGSRAVVNALLETRPWVTFFGALGLMASALYVLFGVFILSGGLDFPRDVSNFGLVYFVMAAVYVPPSVYLLKYRSAISRFAAGRESALIAALESQKSFWKYTGIASLMSFGMMLVYAALVFMSR